MILPKVITLIAACSFNFVTLGFFEKKPALYIIIHGTWSSPRYWLFHKNPRWYQEGHPSFEAFKTTCNAPIRAHIWSGKNHQDDREKGAQELVRELKQLAPQYNIYIIGHSHGGNVALLALHYLAQEKSPIRVEELIMLGTPIYLDWYSDCLHIAHTIYNIFSYGDIIQTVAGMYERVLPEHEHIYNIQLQLNNSCPTHNQLHNKEIMRHLTKFYKIFAKKGVYCLHCKEGKEPFIRADITREKDLDIDKKFTAQLLTSWAETRERHAQSRSNNNHWPTRLRDRGIKYHKTITCFIKNARSKD